MPSTKVDALNPQMQAILEALDKTEPRDMYTVAEMLGSGYWTVYPYFRKLEDLGLIKPGAFRKDKKKTYVLADTNATPSIHVAGNNAAPVAIFNIAKGAPLAKAKGTETATYVNNFPYMLLRLYNLAFATQAGHSFDRKVFQEIRSDMVMLRNRLENMQHALNELLAHPIMSGSPNLLVDILANDPNCPLDRDEVSRLMAECEKEAVKND